MIRTFPVLILSIMTLALYSCKAKPESQTPRSQTSNNTAANPDCACCKAPYTAFDFWEGHWMVTDTLGNRVGSNRIVKKEANCVLQEHWTGAKGSSGTSINYYNAQDDSWHQTWVSNTGFVLQLKGGISDGKMVLKSKLIEGKPTSYYNQISWTPNANGTVTQLWETFTEDDQLLRQVFKGIYIRKD